MKKTIIILALALSFYSCNNMISKYDYTIKVKYTDNTEEILTLNNINSLYLREGCIIADSHAKACFVKRMVILSKIERKIKD